MAMDPLQVGELHSACTINENFTCSWILNRFSELDPTPGIEYRSRRLLSDEDKGHMDFYLWISPGGRKKEDTAGSVSAGIVCSNIPEEGIILKYKMELKNTNQETIVSYNDEVVDGILDKKELLEGLIDDTLVVHVEGCYSVTRVDSDGSPTCVFHDANPGSEVSNSLSLLWHDRRYSDVVVCVNTVEIPAHAAVLAAKSKTFAEIIQERRLGRRPVYIKVDEYNPEVVHAMLQFMYCGHVDALHDLSNARELMDAAEEYQVDGLKAYCRDARLDDPRVMQLS